MIFLMMGCFDKNITAARRMIAGLSNQKTVTLKRNPEKYTHQKGCQYTSSKCPQTSFFSMCPPKEEDDNHSVYS
jgi:hypothetical protein